MLHSKVCKTCRRPTPNRNGYCDACHSRYVTTHVPKASEPTPRAKTAQRGYDSAWNRFARGYLSEHPRCEICGAPSSCVDHKSMTAQEMMAVYGRFILEEKYYQALCTRCNVRKGAHEDKQRNQAFDAQMKELQDANQ